MPNTLRNAALIVAIAWLTGLAPVSAQSAAPASGPIRCAHCPLSGQKPNAPSFDESQVKFVGPLRLVFHENQTIQVDVIARVLLTSPFMLEVLDGRVQLIDRNMKPVRQDVDDRNDYVCSISRIESVDLASKQILTRLRFNDVITARLVMQRNEQMPDALLAGTEVLTGIRRVAAPVRYFHTPALAGCSNRSGRLLEYRGLANDALTVYNDGAIHYRDPLSRRFERERLSDRELSELLQAFGPAHFDALPADIGPAKWGPLPGISLLAARYQDVWLGGNEGPLAPLVRRMNDLAARATSHSYFLLKAGRPQRLTIEAWPYGQVSLTGFREFRDRALMRRQSGSGDASRDARALEEQLPDEFLDRLPVRIPMVATDDDPNRFLYFSQADKLYRVARNPRCSGDAWYCKTSYSLEVEELQGIEARLRAQAARTFVVTGYRGRNREMPQTQAVDPARLSEFGLALDSTGAPFLWTSDMGTSLAGLPPDGARIPNEEYDRHKAAYFAILKNRESGVDLIENGIVFEHVRVCQIEPGFVEECEVK
jgi:hypothetical protein